MPDKDFQDLTMEDMRRFVFKTLDLCHEFYKNMLKSKLLEFVKDQICKSRRKGHPTSTSFKCLAEGVHLAKHVENLDRVLKQKEFARFVCKLEMRIKWK